MSDAPSSSTGKLAGKTAFITGAARGIGAGVAERLHSHGANVALIGLEPDRLAALADKLGDRAIWHECDVTDIESLHDASAVTVERFGSIDIAIANAGVHWTGSFMQAPLEQLERELEINLNGVLRTNRAVLPHLVDSKGYLLNVASAAASTHTPLVATYAASKAGVEALSNALRQELAAHKVGVGVAYFSFIDTDMVRDAFDHPSTTAALKLLPGPLRKPASLDQAVSAIERGVLKRKHKVWAPRIVGGSIYGRGLLQPLIEMRSMRSRQTAKAVSLATPEAGLDLSGGRGATSQVREAAQQAEQIS